MGTPTIHPFRKSTTAIPSEVLSMICRELCATNSRKTLAAISRTCKRAYDIAVPILYERVRLTEDCSHSLFYGLLFIQPVSPTDHSSKPTNLSRARKMRALTHVITLEVISSPGLPLLLEISEHCDCSPVLAEHVPLILRKLMQVESGAWKKQLLEALEGRLATVSTEADNKPRLFPNCGFLTFRSCDWEYDFIASYLFFRLLPHIFDLSTVHLCLSVEEESLRNQQYDILPAGLIQQLTDDRYASVTIHEVAYALAELKAVRSPLRVFFADACSKEGDRHWPCHTREQRLTELGPYMRMRCSDSSDWERIEFIGAGAVCEYEPRFDEDDPDFDWNKAPYLPVPEEDAQEEIASDVRSAFLKSRDGKSYSVSYTLRSESEACVCCGG